MGGFGSGDWSDVAKRKLTTELCMSISAKSLKDNGFFEENKSGIITWTNEFSELIDYTLTLTGTVFGEQGSCEEGIQRTSGMGTKRP